MSKGWHFSGFMESDYVTFELQVCTQAHTVKLMMMYSQDRVATVLTVL